MPTTAMLSPRQLMDRLRRRPPQDYGELIGPAARLGRVFAPMVADAKADPDAAPFCHIFYGPTGSGKTLLASVVAHQLAGDPLAVRDVAASDADIDTVRRWEQEARLAELFGDWQVLILQELDKMPPAAQVRMLQYLDKLPPRRAVIATSNLEIDQLQGRLQSRAQTWKVLGPTSDEVGDYIRERWELDFYTVGQIAVGCGGNVRQALLDTQSVLDASLADALAA